MAFAGRSNAGKSSTLNTITAQGKLARTSRTPGRTQLINYFALGNNRYLVDLPGFGYAKVARNIKSQWDELLDCYLRQRRSLRGIVLVSDIRHPLSEFDQQMIIWAADADIPLLLLLNKADKFNRGPALTMLAQVKTRLEQQLLSHVDVQLFSALRAQGVDEVRAWLDARLAE